MSDDLARLYRANSRSTAYLDESFEIDGKDTFFIMGCAVIEDGLRSTTRRELTEFYGGTLHAAPMWAAGEKESLAKATELIATCHDGADVVVCAPLGKDDPHGDRARIKCIEYLAPILHAQDEVDLFVFDKPSTPSISKRDHWAFRDLVKAEKLSRAVAVGHVYPSEEPLLGLPDMIAWAYRQVHVSGNDSWFKPLRGKTRVHEIS